MWLPLKLRTNLNALTSTRIRGCKFKVRSQLSKRSTEKILLDTRAVYTRYMKTTIQNLMYLVSFVSLTSCTINGKISSLTSGDSGTVIYSAPSGAITKSAPLSITPTMTGTLSNFSISPSLPTGLSISSSTGVISGTPTRVMAPTTFTITAQASDGSTVTGTIVFEIGIRFTVNVLTDASDQTPGDESCATAAAQCSLRAAAEESNALTGILTYIDLPAGTVAPTTNISFSSRVVLTGLGAGTSIVNSASGATPVLSFSGSSVTLDGLTVSGGIANAVTTYNGLGISSTATSLTLKNCTVTSNQSTAGGGTVNGIGVYQSGGTLSIDNCTLSSNNSTSTATINGGGLHVTGATSVSITNSTISNNQLNAAAGTQRGAGFYITNTSQARLSKNSVSANRARTFGCGGYINQVPDFQMTTSNFLLNIAAGAGTWGPAMMIDNSSGSIATSTFTSNTVGSMGVITLDSGSTTSFAIKNSTIHRTGNDQASIYPNWYVDLTLEHVTIYTNTATGYALNYGSFSNVNMKNSIISSTGAWHCPPAPGGTFNSLGYNVSGGGMATCNLTGTGDVNGSGAIGLAALASNGGSTDTMAIGTGSSAYNLVPASACSLTTDQRGNARPGTGGGSCDAGAYEY